MGRNHRSKFCAETLLAIADRADCQMLALAPPGPGEDGVAAAESSNGSSLNIDLSTDLSTRVDKFYRLAANPVPGKKQPNQVSVRPARKLVAQLVL
jgi:hypothetical protein